MPEETENLHYTYEPGSIIAVSDKKKADWQDIGIEVAKHLAGSKFDHDQQSHGRRGSGAGGKWKPRNPKRKTYAYSNRWDSPRQKAGEEWANNLSEKEKKAIYEWVGDGSEIRAFQRGDLDNKYLKHLMEERPEKWDAMITGWESALKKAPILEGVTHRGLTDIPYETVNKWIKDGGLEFNCDQSSSISKEKAIGFMGSKINKIPEIMFTMKGKSADISFQSNTILREDETIIERGSRYKITGVKWWNYRGTFHETFDDLDSFDIIKHNESKLALEGYYEIILEQIDD